MNNLNNHESSEDNQLLQYYIDNLIDQSLKFNEDVKSFSRDLINLSRNVAIDKVDDVQFREILLQEAKLFEKRHFLTFFKPLRALNQKNFQRKVLTETETTPL